MDEEKKPEPRQLSEDELEDAAGGVTLSFSLRTYEYNTLVKCPDCSYEHREVYPAAKYDSFEEDCKAGWVHCPRCGGKLYIADCIGHTRSTFSCE